MHVNAPRGSASAIFGKSNEMRAGLSMVNDSGCGAGPDKRIVSCNCWPGSVCTSMAWSFAVASAALAAALQSAPRAQATVSHASVARVRVRRAVTFHYFKAPATAD